jgi:hypothetical protein
VYSYLNSQWIQQSILYSAQGSPEKSFFGWSLSLFKNTALIGAYGNNEAYIFHSNSNSNLWSQQQILHPFDGEPGDIFSQTLAISGHTAIISSKFDNDMGSLSGSVYVFANIIEGRNSINSWSFMSKLLPSNGVEHDNFGSSLALSNDHMIAIGTNRRNLYNGIIYMYTLTPIDYDLDESYNFFSEKDSLKNIYTYYSWSQQQILHVSDHTDNRFGTSVAILSDEIHLAGSSSNDTYIFEDFITVSDGPTEIPIPSIEFISITLVLGFILIPISIFIIKKSRKKRTSELVTFKPSEGVQKIIARSLQDTAERNAKEKDNEIDKIVPISIDQIAKGKSRRDIRDRLDIELIGDITSDITEGIELDFNIEFAETIRTESFIRQKNKNSSMYEDVHGENIYGENSDYLIPVTSSNTNANTNIFSILELSNEIYYEDIPISILLSCLNLCFLYILFLLKQYLYAYLIIVWYLSLTILPLFLITMDLKKPKYLGKFLSTGIQKKTIKLDPPGKWIFGDFHIIFLCFTGSTDLIRCLPWRCTTYVVNSLGFPCSTVFKLCIYGSISLNLGLILIQFLALVFPIATGEYFTSSEEQFDITQGYIYSTSSYSIPYYSKNSNFTRNFISSGEWLGILNILLLIFKLYKIFKNWNHLIFEKNFKSTLQKLRDLGNMMDLSQWGSSHNSKRWHLKDNDDDDDDDDEFDNPNEVRNAIHNDIEINNNISDLISNSSKSHKLNINNINNNINDLISNSNKSTKSYINNDHDLISNSSKSIHFVDNNIQINNRNNINDLISSSSSSSSNSNSSNNNEETLIDEEIEVNKPSRKITFIPRPPSQAINTITNENPDITITTNNNNNNKSFRPTKLNNDNNNNNNNSPSFRPKIIINSSTHVAPVITKPNHLETKPQNISPNSLTRPSPPMKPGNDLSNKFKQRIDENDSFRKFRLQRVKSNINVADNKKDTKDNDFFGI